MAVAQIYGSPGLLAVIVGLYLVYRGVEVAALRSLKTTDVPPVSGLVAAFSAGFGGFLIYRGVARGASVTTVSGVLLFVAAADVLWRSRRRRSRS